MLVNTHTYVHMKNERYSRRPPPHPPSSPPIRTDRALALSAITGLAYYLSILNYIQKDGKDRRNCNDKVCKENLVPHDDSCALERFSNECGVLADILEFQ